MFSERAMEYELGLPPGNDSEIWGLKKSKEYFTITLANTLGLDYMDSLKKIDLEISRLKNIKK